MVSARVRLLAGVGALALLLGGCSRVQSNDPTAYDAQTEQNFYRGCLAAFDVDTDALIGLADEEALAEVLERAPADSREYCGCVYEGAVDQIPIDRFNEIETTLLEELPEVSGDGEGDGGTTTTVEVSDDVRELVESCGAPR